MIESQSHFDVEAGSERSFGLVFATVFLLIGVVPMLFGRGIGWYWLVASAVLAALSIVVPAIFRVPNRLWLRFGLFLGHIVGTLIMALIFFLVVFPTGFLIKCFGKDLLKEGLDPDAETYWIKREHEVGTMKNQF